MQHPFNNDVEELEPRITPKPTTKVENIAVSSVPEVSLIFDRTTENKHSKTGVSASPSFDKHTSYAAWKQQNFSQFPSHKVNDSNKSRRAQHEYACNAVTSIQNASRSNNEIISDNKTSKRDGHIQGREQDRLRSYNQHNRLQHINNTTHLMSYEHNRDYPDYNEMSGLPYNTKQELNSYNERHNHNTNLSNIPQNKKDLALQNCMPAQINMNNVENLQHMHNLNTVPGVFPNNKFPTMPHPGYPYPYFDMNAYPFPPFYPMPPPNTDNQETIKNLLQLVNTQSEQIQSLQSQVDNLLKMQKEFLIEKKKCVCSSQPVQQNGYIHAGAIDTANYQTTQNQKVKRNVSQSTSVVERNLENSKDIRIRNQPEIMLSEQHPEKNVMEQQVSIGVMTSFEFTVQNSPIVVDYEDLQKDDIQNDVMNRRNNKHDTCETIKRNKSCFTRLPVGQLENIVEDSESYLSSSQPQSSNFNVSCSTKDLQEKRNHVDTQNIRNVPIERVEESSELNKDNLPNSNKLHAQKPTYSKTDYEKQKLREEDTPIYTKGMVSSPYNYEHCIKNAAYKSPQKYMKTKNENKSNKSDGSTKSNKCVEDSLVLSGGDFRVNEMPPVTPEPSIHVDIQEYSSDEESEQIKRTSRVGWTFYNNVLGQVNQILQNSSTMEGNDSKDIKTRNNAEQDEVENKTILDTVKVATLEQLRKLGISLADKPESREKNGTKKVEFDSSFYPRLDYQANITRATSGITETNTSMHMKALALKYLSDEQLAELAVQKQGSASLKQVMLSNMQGTNMSFATMRYLERYQLLPGKNNAQVDDNGVMCMEGPPKMDQKTPNIPNSPVAQRYPFTQMPRTSCPSKILDISTLKQQPKLL